MKARVRDLIKLKILGQARLIAGKSGLDREVTGAGILDYELDSVLRDIYQHTNFQPGDIVLSSFVYAKDNDHLIADALRYLVGQEASGLVIRNVYDLTIHDYILRYADSMGLPLFLAEEAEPYFEDIIYQVEDLVTRAGRMDYGVRELDTILHGSLSQDRVRDYALQVNPSLKPHFFALFIWPKKAQDQDQALEIFEAYNKSSLDLPSASLLSYKGGYLYIYSAKGLGPAQARDLALKAKKSLDPQDQAYLGLGRVHYFQSQMKEAIEEALGSAVCGRICHQDLMAYEDLGSYQALLPLVRARSETGFGQDIFERLMAYDAENGLNLTRTLVDLIRHKGRMGDLAESLGVHENTIRNRMEKVRQVTGLNFRDYDDYEHLSLAVKYRLLREAMEDFL